MYKRFVLFIFILFNVFSCETIFTKNTSEKDIKPNNLEVIDFSSVDAYPLLPECEKFTSRKVQKACFYKFLSKRIELSLTEKKIVFPNNYTDTIQVVININSKGKVSLKSIDLEKNNELKNIIIQSIATLPQIQPAIKSGIPVTTEFILPIVLKTNS